MSCHMRDPYTNRIDTTEGFGAFDSILAKYVLGRRTIDIGGGSTDLNRAYVKERYDTTLSVYDPLKLEAENILVLSEAPFDSCTSNSVLNVIATSEDRLEHIRMCWLVLKETGRVFFKIWQGNCTGIPNYYNGNYQSNSTPQSYLTEIESVFGRNNVILDVDCDLIVCRKLNP